VILGAISIFGIELVVPGYYHFILLKSLMRIHVSSMFKNTFFFRDWARNSRAQRCRRTRFFSELECRDTVLIFLNRMPSSSRITDLTMVLVTGFLSFALMLSATDLAESTIRPKSMEICTDSIMSCRRDSTDADFSSISLRNYGLLLALSIRAATTPGETRCALATSACFSCPTYT
jgi:hypothetical protein